MSTTRHVIRTISAWLLAGALLAGCRSLPEEDLTASVVPQTEGPSEKSSTPAQAPSRTSVATPAEATKDRPALPPLQPPLSRPTAPSLTFYEVTMVNEHVGWAWGKALGHGISLVLRTEDGGQTWRDVTPPETQNGFGGTGFFLDGERAWAAYNENEGWPGYRGLVWRTTDGGETWTSSDDTDPSGEAELVDYIYFIDDRHGCLQNRVIYSMGSGKVDIYRTSDGGASWRLEASSGEGPNTSVDRPFCSAMAFERTDFEGQIGLKTEGDVASNPDPVSSLGSQGVVLPPLDLLDLIEGVLL